MSCELHSARAYVPIRTKMLQERKKNQRTKGRRALSAVDRGAATGHSTRSTLTLSTHGAAAVFGLGDNATHSRHTSQLTPETFNRDIYKRRGAARCSLLRRHQQSAIGNQHRRWQTNSPLPLPVHLHLH